MIVIYVPFEPIRFIHHEIEYPYFIKRCQLEIQFQPCIKFNFIKLVIDILLVELWIAELGKEKETLEKVFAPSCCPFAQAAPQIGMMYLVNDIVDPVLEKLFSLGQVPVFQKRKHFITIAQQL